MSAGLAWYIAHGGFWFLLAYGYFWDEISARAAVIFIAVWAALIFGVPLTGFGGDLSTSVVAVLDIVLVLIVFKGDVRLS